MRIILLASTALILAACGPFGGQPDGSAGSKQAGPAHQIPPETIVTFPKGPILCRTEEALRRAFINALAGNEAPLGSRFEGDAECITLDPATRYRVVDADLLGPEMPEAAVIEVVDEKAAATAPGTFVLVLNNDFVKVEQRPQR